MPSVTMARWLTPRFPWRVAVRRNCLRRLVGRSMRFRWRQASRPRHGCRRWLPLLGITGRVCRRRRRLRAVGLPWPLPPATRRGRRRGRPRLARRIAPRSSSASSAVSPKREAFAAAPMPLAPGRHGCGPAQTALRFRWLAAAFGPQVRLGRGPAPAAAQRLDVRPSPDDPGPARASRVLVRSPKREAFAAGMTVASTKCRCRSASPRAPASACSAVKAWSQVPAARQRQNRLDTVPTGPWRPGRSRQGAPVQCTHSMPFRMRRWSSFGRPIQGFPGGNNGSRRRHRASISSLRLTPSIWDHRPETSAVCRHALALLWHFGMPI